ncbi:DUF2490 domain-containing protein [Pseudoflavitalea sp. X16]|uniref:DUF2490 domain-containing protein n=1 Tax=Paraflavitalea devenefica TaxID=2716334 RepID=UPI00141E6B39|nr:DUF2490 domain-containing protein [Paraflavitalea devenefica]NII24948.1 DUF2490 domain-containing protein [Paraflavitalea devenefica]
MNYRNLFIIGLLLLSFDRTIAQTQFAGWIADFNTFKINTKLSVHADFQLRSTDQLKHVQTLLLRAGLNYHMNKKLVLTTGYAFIHNRSVQAGISGHVPEHRIWEQVLFTHPLTISPGIHGTLAHRLRLEQRFLPRPYVQNHELKHDGNLYANRLRYFIRNVTPLISSATGKAPFLALQNEVFVNIGDKSAVNRKFFDQNRAYIALGYRFNKQFDAELGYMNQYINGRNETFTNNHIVQLATYVRL